MCDDTVPQNPTSSQPVLTNPDADKNISLVFWSIVIILLVFMCLMHLGILASFIISTRLVILVTPFAVIGSIAAGEAVLRREGADGWIRLTPPCAAIAVIAVSIVLAGAFFDLSWDGLWYHQTAVYQMADGWNPLSDPMHEFTPHLQDWVRHYAKGPWYFSLALFETTSDIELAKALPWLSLVVMFLAVFAASLDAGLRRRTAATIALLVSLNPVVIFELASYLVDGIMIALLATTIAASIRWIKDNRVMHMLIVMMSAILCINAKFTGLVYLCFFIVAGSIYVAIRQREVFRRYVVIQMAAIVLGTVVFGYNPYVTNTIHRGHPLYPILGTAAYPSHAQQGEDAIENVETPKNMMGRNRFVRLGYAIFGRPASYPYPRENALLMRPFDVTRDDFAMYYFHDVRISGFGPLFSGALLISLIVLGVSLYRPGIPRLILLLIWGTAALSLLVSHHTWWARYGPQLWWLPVVAVAAGLSVSEWRYIRWAAWGLAGLLLVNAVSIEMIHFKWEIDATRTTYQQMDMLRGMGTVDIDFKYFEEPFGRRLTTAGVKFNSVRSGSLRRYTTMELMSVSPGYWGAVLVRLPEE